LLKAMLNTAVADEMIVRNPCTVKGAGVDRASERPVASIAEVAAAADAMPERLRLAPLLAAWCQLRRGEVLGLQRRDIDMLHGTIRVERAWAQSADGRTLIAPPKTAAGRRVLAVPPNTLPELSGHLERFTGPGPESWLFTAGGGKPFAISSLEKAWRRARLAAGRPELRFHDLRHSGLTWAAAVGASVRELMARGGHATPTMALRYQHATADRDKALADAMAELVRPAEVAPLHRTNVLHT